MTGFSDKIASVVRDEIARVVPAAIAETWAMSHLVEGTARPVLPVAADLVSERLIVGALVDSRAKLDDLDGLEPGHFIGRIEAVIFAVYKLALEANQRPGIEAVARAIEAQNVASYESTIIALRHFADSAAVVFVPTLADHVRRVRELAALRNLFAVVDRLDMHTRIAAERGAELPDVVAPLRDAVVLVQRARSTQQQTPATPLRSVGKPRGAR